MEAPVDYRAIVIGCSAGGFSALRTILAGLPRNFPVPILVVSHLASGPSQLAGLLAHECVLNVVEAADKLRIMPGHVYVAIPDYHLLLEPDLHLSLSVDPRVNFCRPSIDVLFESAADSLGPAVIGVVLTGANMDGADGLDLIRSKGGIGVVQDPEDAEVDVMPRAAIAKAGADHILPVAGIAGILTAIVMGEDV